jgi:serine/threonine protein kinase
LLLDEHGNLKISDFGLSSLYVGDAEGEGASRTELLHTTCGTPNYVAPEVLSDQGYDGKKADVWSCGVILYVLLAGFLPFDESTIVALFAKIQNADFTYPSWFTPEVRSILDQMLIADPKARISLSALKAHPWFQGGVNPIQMENTHSNTPTIPATPTPAQMEAAVQPVAGGGKTVTGDNNGIEDDDFDDVEVPSTDGAIHGPVKLNAFDVVSYCGGFMIDKMFSPEIFYKSSADDVGSSGGAGAGGHGKSYNNLGGSILFGSSTSTSTKLKCYQFTASNISATDLTKEVVKALEAMGFTMELNKEKSIQNGLIKANYLSAKGMVGMSVQVFILTASLCLLTIRKGKGDLLEWNNAYSELVEKRIGHLLNKGSGPDTDVKEFY